MPYKQKFQMEFPLKASAEMLFQYISNPSGLSEWFAGKVQANANKYTFLWDGHSEEAFMIARRQDRYVRFRWAEENDESTFFELRIEEDELTGDVSLFVSDWAEEENMDEAKKLWNMQINDLKKAIGA